MTTRRASPATKLAEEAAVAAVQERSLSRWLTLKEACELLLDLERRERAAADAAGSGHRVPARPARRAFARRGLGR